MPRSRAIALAAGAVILAAQLFPLAPLRDAATGAPLEGWRLVPSAAHLLTTPISAAADWVTCLSRRQLRAFLAWFIGAWFLLRPLRATPWRGRAREALGFFTHVAGVLAFAAWTVLAPRPVSRLAKPAGASDVLVADLHSHTSHSWDAPRSFTPERNIGWHRAHGYDAAFVTDHNQFDGARLAFDASRLTWRETGFRALRGEELSLHGAHVVVLGNRERIDNEAYAGPEGLRRFLGESRSRHGALALMSLPEYWDHHRDSLEELAAAGAAGFELANGSPKASELPPVGRERVVGLCRARNLFVAGVSDNHGWARSACAWSLIRLPGHEGLDPGRLEAALLERLSSGGFDAVTAAERPVRRPGGALELGFDPLLNLWQCLRALSRAQALVCFLYIGLLTTLTRRAASA